MRWCIYTVYLDPSRGWLVLIKDKNEVIIAANVNTCVFIKSPDVMCVCKNHSHALVRAVTIAFLPRRSLWAHPANTGGWNNGGLRLGQRLRRWPNLKSSLVRRLVFGLTSRPWLCSIQVQQKQIVSSLPTLKDLVLCSIVFSITAAISIIIPGQWYGIP